MIVTFYSYKGGVGRSMAMANVARWLQQKGLRVVMVDWDLEAPGLESFFAEDSERRAVLRTKLGLVDLLLSYKDAFPSLPRPERPIAPDQSADRAVSAADRLRAVGGMLDAALPPLSHTLTAIDAPAVEASGSLRLLTAGCRSPRHFNEYAQAVQRFDWAEFYARYEGEAYFEWMRRQLVHENAADIVLIDSRTGVAEMSGACTRQLADVVVVLCAPNDQNLEGVALMADSFTRADVIEARGGRSIELVMVPARIDVGDGRPVDLFDERFDEKLSRFLPKAFSAAGTDFQKLRIPYVSAYAYSERLAIGDREGVKAMQEAYESLAVHLALLAPAGSATRRQCAAELERRFRLPAEGSSQAVAVRVPTIVPPAPLPRSAKPAPVPPGHGSALARRMSGAFSSLFRGLPGLATAATLLVSIIGWRYWRHEPLPQGNERCGGEAQDCQTVITKANDALSNEKADDALKKYEQVIEGTTNSSLKRDALLGRAAARWKLAQGGNIKADDYAKVRTDLELIGNLAPTDIVFQLLAKVNDDSGNVAAARSSIEKGLKLNPDNASLLTLQAKLFERESDFKSANRDYQRALLAISESKTSVPSASLWSATFELTMPEQSQIRMNVADTLARLGDGDAALVAYDRAIEEDGRLWAARYSRATLLLKRASSATGANKKWLTRQALDDLIRVSDGDDQKLAKDARLQVENLGGSRTAVYSYYLSPGDELRALTFTWAVDGYRWAQNAEPSFFGLRPDFATVGSPQGDQRSADKLYAADTTALEAQARKVQRIATEMLGIQLPLARLDPAKHQGLEVRLGLLPKRTGAATSFFTLVDWYDHAIAAGRLDEAAYLLNGFKKESIEARLKLLSREDMAALHDAAVKTPGVGSQSNVALMSLPDATSAVPAAPRKPPEQPNLPKKAPSEPKPGAALDCDSICRDALCDRCIGIDDGYEGGDKLEKACWTSCLSDVDKCKCPK